MAKQFTLGKNERLKSRKSIEQLFKDGQRFSVSLFRIFYQVNKEILNAQQTPPAGQEGIFSRSLVDNIQFGIGVSSKNFKRAVDRNRIKRLARESYRLQKNPLHEKVKSKNIRLNIFFIYTGKELPEYNEVYKKVGSALSQLDKLIDTVQ